MGLGLPLQDSGGAAARPRPPDLLHRPFPAETRAETQVLASAWACVVARVAGQRPPPAPGAQGSAAVSTAAGIEGTRGPTPRPAPPRRSPARRARPPCRLCHRLRRRRRHCCGGTGAAGGAASARRGPEARGLCQARSRGGAGPPPPRPPTRNAALRPSMAGPGPTFPLHRLVWANRHRELEAALHSRQHDIEQEDPRGRTPLELAVSLGNLESVRVLLRHNANVGKESCQGWAVLQEAVSTGDPEMVQLVLQYRDYQRATQRLAGIPELLNKLRQAPDFYVEMKWEFTSWVPLVSKMCPSDVYRVWKRGESLRVDTSLLGFEHMTWQRGRRSFIFKGKGALVMEVDHDRQVVHTETLGLTLHEPEALLAAMRPSEEHVASRLTSPIVSTHLDTRNVAFERNKCGIWGWRSEKMETVSGYEAKVYSATNVELVTRTRTEHLSDQDKSKSKGGKTPFQSFLGMAQQHSSHNGASVHQAASSTNPTAISPDEYFDPNFSLESRNIGRPIEMSSKVQRFKATLWLSEEHPLSLSDQVTPIIDLMAISNAHFAKLRDFITLRLPPGFPVKIEIPLFHVLNARITFSNLCGCDEPLSSVWVPAPSSAIPASGSPFPCEVDPAVFEVPEGYSVLGAERSEPLRDEDDDLLQFAIQQSLLEAGTEAEQPTRSSFSWSGPSRKACGCPQSPGVTGRPLSRLPPALRSSFAWPWSCLLRSRRSGSGGGSRRRKTYSGSCSSRSQSTEPLAPGRAVRDAPPPTFVTYLFINTLLLSLGPGAPGWAFFGDRGGNKETLSSRLALLIRGGGERHRRH
ncbi:ankyrin repeat domain-containing protein 13D isoform X2 [Camelus bactrianus]|uniref:Ankyrin repeat domain-containing protein 13D isoform X2 n=1 Tax=Camelus bactrianus TaxID=9837 RepID=A0AC58QZN6_CAMBA